MSDGHHKFIEKDKVEQWTREYCHSQEFKDILLHCERQVAAVVQRCGDLIHPQAFPSFGLSVGASILTNILFIADHLDPLTDEKLDRCFLDLRASVINNLQIFKQRAEQRGRQEQQK